MKLISIVLPTYNRKFCIANSIESILNQTYQNWELVIVDDASTDCTTEYIKEHYKDARIRVLSNNENRGANYSRNKGIANSKGELITFIDSDVVYDDNKLEKQISVLESNQECEWMFSNFRFQFGNLKCNLLNKTKIESIQNNGIINELSFGNFIDTSSIMLRKRILNKGVKFDEKLPRLQDYDFAIQLAYHSIPIMDTCATYTNIYNEESISTNQIALWKAIRILYIKHKKLFGQEQFERLIDNIKRTREIAPDDEKDILKEIDGICFDRPDLSLDKLALLESNNRNSNARYKRTSLSSLGTILMSSEYKKCDLYIYGDRKRAGILENSLERMANYKLNFKGYVVSKKDIDDQRENVIEFDETRIDKDSLIVIAVVNGADNIYEMLLDKKYENVFLF